jgi:hypothetical protein
MKLDITDMDFYSIVYLCFSKTVNDANPTIQ